MEKLKPVFIVDGSRTPFMKARGVPGPWSACDLAVQTGKSLLLRQNFSPEEIDEVILGCAMSSSDEANIARIAALRLGCGIETPAWTVQRNCGSGLQALASAAQSIGNGYAEIILTGGTEAMSRAPLVWNLTMLKWLGNWRNAKSLSARFNSLLKFRLSFLKPDAALLKGLTDPFTGFNMGQTAEELAFDFNIERVQMDAYALASHQRLAKAYDEKRFSEEITPLMDPMTGKIYKEDDGLRRTISSEALAKLSSVFDKPHGHITAGNSSQVSDGACLLILASEEAVKKHNLPILGRIHDIQWTGLAPEKMGLGPVYASSALLARKGLTFDDIDYWEINEAFAAQVIACASFWKEDKEKKFRPLWGKWDGSFDQFHQKLNVDGGAVSLGHPVGASGARLVLHLLHVLKQKDAKKGLASLCIGGGQGGAILLERE